MPDTRNVLARLGDSRAFIFALLMLVIVGILVGLGKVAYAELVSLAKWLGVTFVGGKSLEGMAAALFTGKAPDVTAVGENASASSKVETAPVQP